MVPVGEGIGETNGDWLQERGGRGLDGRAAKELLPSSTIREVKNSLISVDGKRIIHL